VATALAEGAAPAAPEVPFPRALATWPRVRQSLLGAFDLCSLEARLAQEFEYLDPLDPADEALERLQWHTHPQARGTIFHRWAARLLHLLSALDQDALADAVECPDCGARPNDESHREGDTKVYVENNLCHVCGRALLKRVSLTEEALDLLCEVLRQDDIADEDVVRVPQAHVKDLEWIVCKFSREQRFQIANFIDAEDRLHATLEYPNPHGGVVVRELSGQIDAWFAEELEDGSLHAYVIDWKDTWAIPGATTISREGYWQQRFYAWLVMKNNPTVNAVTLREVYVRYKGGDSGRDNHREATITRDRLPMIERQLAIVTESFDRAMEAWLDLRAFEAEHSEVLAAVAPPDTDGEGGTHHPDPQPSPIHARHEVLKRRVKALFAPSPGGHCNYCPLPHRCPIVDEVRVHGTIRNPEDAKRIANELAVISRAKKHREEALRGYLERARSAPVTVKTEDELVKLRTYKDKPPGLPEGVPLQTAKGKKSYALVESTRKSRPERETVEDLLERARNGEKVDLDAYYREASSTTMRLVEEKVPVDDAPSPEVEASLARSLERLERIRATA
jgi:hypothetical protein